MCERLIEASLKLADAVRDKARRVQRSWDERTGNPESFRRKIIGTLKDVLGDDPAWSE